MPGEIKGSLLMALGGFLLMFAITGKEFHYVFRIIPFMIGSIWFFYGARIFKRSLTGVIIVTRDFLIIFLAIFTPFIVLILLDLIGLMYGVIGVIVWVVFASILVLKWEKIIDKLLPRLENKPTYEKREEIRRMLNPSLYYYRTKKKKENK